MAFLSCDNYLLRWRCDLRLFTLSTCVQNPVHCQIITPLPRRARVVSSPPASHSSSSNSRDGRRLYQRSLHTVRCWSRCCSITNLRPRYICGHSQFHVGRLLDVVSSRELFVLWELCHQLWHVVPGRLRIGDRSRLLGWRQIPRTCQQQHDRRTAAHPSAQFTRVWASCRGVEVTADRMVSLHFTSLALEAMYKHLLHEVNVSSKFAEASPLDMATLIG